MNEALVQFADRLAAPAGSVCAACGFDSLLVQDHCHKHGWVRATACMRCNQYLGQIDRCIRPGVGETLLTALLAVRNRCSECAPLGGADLVNQAPKRAATPSGNPQDRWMRLCRLAARRGYKLAAVRYSGTYEVTLPRKPYRKAFASVDAVEEFLAR
jgi:hypothetical protein